MQKHVVDTNVLYSLVFIKYKCRKVRRTFADILFQYRKAGHEPENNGALGYWRDVEHLYACRL